MEHERSKQYKFFVQTDANKFKNSFQIQIKSGNKVW